MLVCGSDVVETEGRVTDGARVGLGVSDDVGVVTTTCTGARLTVSVEDVVVPAPAFSL